MTSTSTFKGPRQGQQRERERETRESGRKKRNEASFVVLFGARFARFEGHERGKSGFWNWELGT